MKALLFEMTILSSPDMIISEYAWACKRSPKLGHGFNLDHADWIPISRGLPVTERLAFSGLNTSAPHLQKNQLVAHFLSVGGVDIN
ncbi:hypothetical protein T4A_14026 [Trichinella pseudospiralis]|uniref:Uncharacterized protein n=2 Tax=Trichinella pseudospiralis TaxID=6337 RepID=A0A0V1FM24_TRIPS|nr:hypothetical protein T4A_14026 [Trichinella pseudospiralis]KRY87078.1 hypothetical protein T4D_788 [Trichinella pseudospiralis]KRZ40790.1 hypothetical protein T4C_9346 [Trichinella pseudospiralis]